ncbi:MAG: hypothetical protein PW788_01120 [Micavibrio sp.]|nr:hypothetical protein [Micavibrio sp.]
MKTLAIAVLFALCLTATAATAATSGCYSPKEIEAEQGLRIHSELMVIGLTCMRMPQGQQNYMKYQSFTQKNSHLISKYETDMIDHYRAEGAKNPEAKLHTLRTTLANQISQHAIQMSTSTFCQRFSPRIDQALAMDQKKFRSWAQHVYPGTKTFEPTCTVGKL